jgi:hypothetical protein
MFNPTTSRFASKWLDSHEPKEYNTAMSKPHYSTPIKPMTNVMVYRNLTKRCWSIKCRTTNRVIAHADNIQMVNVRFHVSESGRQRVLRERKKYVHAGAIGDCYAFNPSDVNGEEMQVFYNPYKNSTFVDGVGNPVKTATHATLDYYGRVYVVSNAA